MITNFQKQSRKDDVKLLVWIVVGFLFIAWFCSPPGNKLLQLCFWGNNTISSLNFSVIIVLLSIYFIEIMLFILQKCIQINQRL